MCNGRHRRIKECKGEQRPRVSARESEVQLEVKVKIAASRFTKDLLES